MQTTGDEFTRDISILRYQVPFGGTTTLSATADLKNKVNLAWTSSAIGEIGFQISRATSLSSDGKYLQNPFVLGFADVDNQTFQDATAQPGTTYYYQVAPVVVTGTPSTITPLGESNVATVATVPDDVDFVEQEDIAVPIDGTTVTSATSLETGKIYAITASGYFNIGGVDNRYQSDSEYAYYLPDPSPWNYGHKADHVDFGIGINDPVSDQLKFPVWGSANTAGDHSYSISMVGLGAPIALNYHDDFYPDNSIGATDTPLHVRIYRARPSAPANLTASPQHDTRGIQLAWAKRTSLDGYVSVERATLSGAFSEIARVKLDQNGYFDASATFGSAYRYRTRVVSSTEVSAYSNESFAVLVNAAPVIAPFAAQIAAVGTPFSLSIDASDPDGPSSKLTYVLSGAPAGVTISTDGLIEWASPSKNNQSNEYSAAVTVTDGDGATTQAVFNLSVVDPKEGPQIDGSPHATEQSPTVVDLSVAAHSPNPNEVLRETEENYFHYTWSAVDWPTGSFRPDFSFNASNAAHDTSATLHAAGDYTFRVTITGLGYPAVSEDVSYHLDEVADSVRISPQTSWAVQGEIGDDTYTETVLNQFGLPMTAQPAVIWSVEGGGGSFEVGSDGKRRFHAAPDPALGVSSSQKQVTFDATVSGSNLFGTGSVTVAADDDAGSGPVINGIDITAVSDRVIRMKVDATDSDPSAALTYSWTIAHKPDGVADPVFSVNDSAAAADVLVTTQAGLLNYTFTLTVRDANGRKVSEDEQITDFQALTNVVVTPNADSPRALVPGGTMVVSAAQLDAIGRPMGTPLSPVVWSAVDETTGVAIDNVVTVDPVTGFATITAPTGVQAFIVKAVVGGVTGVLQVMVATQQPAVLKIDGLQNSDDFAKPFLINQSTDVGVLADDINDEDPVSWRLWLTDSKSNRTQLAGADVRSGTLPDTYANAATIDPTTLADGLYTLTLTDGQGTVVADSRTIDVESQFKRGGLTLPFVDASAAVPNGTPITATRTYDSMQSQVLGDFGYGWTLAMADTGFRSTARSGEYTSGGVDALRSGDVVYLKTPDGQQHAFMFMPKKETDSELNFAGVVPSLPRFVCIDGSAARLEVNTALSDTTGIDLQQDAATGEWFYSGGTGYNPAKAQFGNTNQTYRLIDDAGTTFTYNSQGNLQSSDDLNGNHTDYSGYSSGAAQLAVRRETVHGQSLLTGISDAPGYSFTSSPDDPSKYVAYTYTDALDLDTVRDRSGAVTHFEYEMVGGVSTHRLTKIIGPDGVAVLAADYDPSTHQLSTVAGATGATSSVVNGDFDGQTSSSAVKDAAGNSTELIRNDQGDVIREIKQIKDAVGVVTGYQVTVHNYVYGGWNAAEQHYADLFGATNFNKLLSSEDFAPFVIAGTDRAGARYTQLPAPSTSLQSTDFNFVSDGTPDAATDPAMFQPRVQTVQGPHGSKSTTFLQYAAYGKPSIIQDEHGTLTWMLYDAAHNPTATINALGEGTETVYGTTGGSKGQPIATYRVRVATAGTASSLPSGLVRLGDAMSTTTYYDATNAATGAFIGKVSTTTDAAGVTTRYKYDSEGRTTATYREWTDGSGSHTVLESGTHYDAAGRVDQVTDSHGKSTFTHYDLSGRVSYTEDAYGAKTATVYDIGGNVIRTVYADGTETRTAYDVLGRVAFTSDRFYSGATIDSDGVPSPAADLTSLVTRTIYDSLGRTIGTERYKDALIQIAASVTESGSQLTAVAPSADQLLLNGKRVSSTSTAYYDNGTVKESKDAAQSLTQSDYYDDGELKTVTTAAGTADTATTHYDYDLTSGAMPAGAVSYDTVTVSNTTGDQVTTTYKDGVGRTIRVKYADGTLSDTVYSLTGIADPRYQVVTNGTSALPSIDAGGTETISLAESTPSATDPTHPTTDSAKATIRLYDASGRLTDVYLPPPAPGQDNPHWHYGYDANGNETLQRDPNGHETKFTYDDNGNRASRTLPPDSDGNLTDDTESWTYDAFGRMATHTDFKGQTTKYVYDDTPAHGGWLIEEQRFIGPATATPAEKTVYGYDTLGRQNVVDEYADGDMATPMRHTKTDYDPITGGVIKIDSPEGVLQHEYDSATGRLKRTYTANNDTAYTYDAQGRLWKVIVSKLNGVSYATPLTTTYAYDKAGNLLSTVSDEGTATPDDNVSESDTYDPMNRLTGLTAKVGSHAIFDQGGFTYAPDGQKTGLLEHRYDATSGSTTATTRMTWAYDADDRLTSEQRDEGDDSIQNNGDYTDTYTFDPNGNRLTKTHDVVGADTFTKFRYNDRDELASTQTNSGLTEAIAYDANGSTLAAGNTTYTWDLRNQTATVTVSGVTTTYAYDENGVRVGKTTEGHTIVFLNDAQNPTGYAKPIEEIVNGMLSHSYVIGLVVLTQSDLGGVTDLVRDGQCRARTLVLHGISTQAVDYDAFDSVLGSVFPNTPFATVDGYVDAETGAYYQAARYRKSDRFLTIDDYEAPTEDPRSLNKFLYGEDNPVSFVDLSGHMSEQVAALGLAAFLVTMTLKAVVDGLGASYRAAMAHTWQQRLQYNEFAALSALSLFGGTSNLTPKPQFILIGTNAGVVARGSITSGGLTFYSLSNQAKGFVGEINGWFEALDRGEAPIHPPTNPSKPGPDFATLEFDANGNPQLNIWDAKWMTGPNSLAARKLAAWLPEVQKSIDSMPDGPLKDAAQWAIDKGRVVGKMYFYKQK